MKPQSLLIAFALAVTSPAPASQMPRAGTADARIKTVVYNPQDVVAVRGYYGYATLIEFAPAEAGFWGRAGS